MHNGLVMFEPAKFQKDPEKVRKGQERSGKKSGKSRKGRGWAPSLFSTQGRVLKTAHPI